jgi:hypothetical protein
VKQRLLVPSPYTVIGSRQRLPDEAGITMPYCPVCRGPTVLNSRTTTVGSRFSRQ